MGDMGFAIAFIVLGSCIVIVLYLLLTMEHDNGEPPPIPPQERAPEQRLDEKD